MRFDDGTQHTFTIATSEQDISQLPGIIHPLYEGCVLHPDQTPLTIDMYVHSKTLVDARVDHRHGLLPSGGILGEHEARAASVDVVDGVASRDFGDAADGCGGSRGVDAHRDGSGDGLCSIAEVGAPGKLQLEGDADAVRSA